MSTAKTIALMVGGTIAFIVTAAAIDVRRQARAPKYVWTDANRWER